MRFCKLLLSTLTALALTGTMASSEAAEKTLHIGTEGALPPFEVLQPDGSVTGFDIDIAQALCQKIKAKCDVTASDFDGLIPSLEAKKIDLVSASLSITEERKKAVDFTDPIYTNRLQFVAPKDGEFKTDKDSLKGKVIGAQRSTLSSTWLEDHYGKDVDIKLYDTQENTFLDLASGRIDAVLVDVFPAIEWLKSDTGKDFELKGQPVFEGDKIGIAVRKGDPVLKKLNAALKEIRNDGTYKKINDKYFPLDIY